MKNFKTANAPSIIFRLKDIEDRNKIVLFNIADLLNKKVNINIELLAYVCGCSPRTINRRLNELEESGYISRETKYIDKKRQSTISIQWNKIQEISVKSDFFNTEEDDEELVEVETKEEPVENKIGVKQYCENFNQDTNMGNCIGTLTEVKNKSEQQKEETITYSMDSIIPWEQYKSDYGYVIGRIIQGYNSTLKINQRQAEEDLKSLLKKSVSKPYKDRIMTIINNNVYIQAN